MEALVMEDPDITIAEIKEVMHLSIQKEGRRASLATAWKSQRIQTAKATGTNL
jgi:hypothetical protein